MTTPDDDALNKPSPPPAEPALDAVSLTALRGPAVRRLLTLRAEHRLTREHVHTTAACLNVSDRTVWRWLADAATAPEAASRPGARHLERFEITPEIRVLLAYWRGNASAVHRELLARARSAEAEPTAVDASGTAPVPHRCASLPGGAPPAAVPVLESVPSLATFLRAVRRDLTPGERAGFRGGPEAARALDVFGQRPPVWRNHVWEADHVQAPLRVKADGELVRPYITWFIDCATKAITGVAVTPSYPSRASILAALRCAVLRCDPYGPFGGRPEQIRIDRGKDFLSATVTAAFGAFGTTVNDLPPYSPHLKGTVENLNRAAERMLFAALPGYTTKQPRRRDRQPTAPELSFKEFTAELLAWVTWWNTEHHPAALDDRTPLQAWQADPTPLTDIAPQDVWTFTLEDDGRTRTITSHGVRFRNRDYIAAWMTDQSGREVTVRYMPHHDDEIEVCDPRGRHLGTAHLADRATPQQLAALRRARTQRAQRLRAEAKAAEKLRRTRFAPATEATEPKRLGALTEAEADAELSQAGASRMHELALPSLIPPAPPPSHWRTPTAGRGDTGAAVPGAGTLAGLGPDRAPGDGEEGADR